MFVKDMQRKLNIRVILMVLVVVGFMARNFLFVVSEVNVKSTSNIKAKNIILWR